MSSWVAGRRPSIASRHRPAPLASSRSSAPRMRRVDGALDGVAEVVCRPGHFLAVTQPPLRSAAPLALQHEIRPNHIRPAAELAERVLLPGDPGRALAVAQALLEQPPRMFNHARGLWGYTGTAPDGELLTVQATGMGGPSTAIVCEELIALGATDAGADRDLRSTRSVD